MGRGRSSSERQVVKQREPFNSSGSGSGGGTAPAAKQNLCNFILSGRIAIKPGLNAEVGDPVTIASDSTDPKRLILLIANQNFGIYSGGKSSLLSTCIEQGFVYEGQVDSVIKTATGTQLEYKVKGKGR